MLGLVAILSACGGTISDEQRKQMLKAKEEQAIVRVTDVQIMEAAFEKGRKAVNGLTESATSQELKQLSENLDVKIRWLAPGASHAMEIEKQLIDAYINSVLMGEEQKDNVQKIGTDSLLYTKPVVITRADSSIEVKGTWNVWISKKELILSMNRK